MPPNFRLATLAQVVRLVPGGGERVAHGARMLAPAGLEDELHRGLADVEVEALADVLDIDEVGSRLADQRQQPGERAGPVRDTREQREPPARLGLVAGGGAGPQAPVP